MIRTKTGIQIPDSLPIHGFVRVKKQAVSVFESARFHCPDQCDSTRMLPRWALTILCSVENNFSGILKMLWKPYSTSPPSKKSLFRSSKRLGVLRSALVGSFAPGEAGPESDVDILVEFPEGETLFDLTDLEGNLKSAPGRKVDSVPCRSLHHLPRDQALREQIPIL